LKQNPGTFPQERLEEIQEKFLSKPNESQWPMTGLSVKEAIKVAEWLGGKLPNTGQWKQASGYDLAEFSKNQSASENQSNSLPPDWNPQVWKRGPFRDSWTNANDPGIALKNYADVGTSALDESYYGCRDMAGNGTELIGQTSNRAARLPLPQEQESRTYCYV